MQGQQTILLDGQLAANFQFASAIAFHPPGPFLVGAAIGQDVYDGAERDSYDKLS